MNTNVMCFKYIVISMFLLSAWAVPGHAETTTVGNWTVVTAPDSNLEAVRRTGTDLFAYASTPILSGNGGAHAWETMNLACRKLPGNKPWLLVLIAPGELLCWTDPECMPKTFSFDDGSSLAVNYSGDNGIYQSELPAVLTAMKANNRLTIGMVRGATTHQISLAGFSKALSTVASECPAEDIAVLLNDRDLAKRTLPNLRIRGLKCGANQDGKQFSVISAYFSIEGDKSKTVRNYAEYGTFANSLEPQASPEMVLVVDYVNSSGEVIHSDVTRPTSSTIQPGFDSGSELGAYHLTSFSDFASWNPTSEYDSAVSCSARLRIRDKGKVDGWEPNLSQDSTVTATFGAFEYVDTNGRQWFRVRN